MLEDKLIEKSKECCTMAIGIDKSLQFTYRVEGFSLFICNARELMLKDILYKRDNMKNYYKDDGNEK